MEQNSIFHDRYQLERLLGRGNFSEVWLAKDNKTQVEVALKIYAPATGLDDEGLNVLAREFSLVVNVNHKNLLKPLFYDTCDRKPYLVLPFCKNGSAMKYVGKMNEQDAWRFIRDVASGIAYLHDHNPSIIHQDIKPDNVMVSDNGDFMITDFGVSTHVRSTLRKSMSSAFSSAGTVAYMAPERFGRDNTPIKANDVYSLGATVFELLNGDTPFGDEGGLLQMKGAEVPGLKGDYSAQLKRVVDRCLATDPWERPTAKQLEQWANSALEGKKIDFGGGRSFLAGNKKIVLISAAAAVVVVGVVLLLTLIPKPDSSKNMAKSSAAVSEAEQNYPHYKELCLLCDSLTKLDEKEPDYAQSLLDAKRKLALVRDYEKKYREVSSDYNASDSLARHLVPVLQKAADGWNNAAATYDNLIGKKDQAEEFRQLARELYDPETDTL